MLASDEIYRRHGQAMAAELEELFRESLWPAYKSGEMAADQLLAMLDNWEQAGAAILVEAFSDAITDPAARSSPGGRCPFRSELAG